MSAVTPLSAAKLPLGGEPRVQLIPPSVRERERARASIRLAVFLVILGLAGAAALVGLGFVRSLASELALQDAQARAAELQAEKAQYAEATEVSTTIDQVEQTQIAATSYEVPLGDLFGELDSELSRGMSLQTITITSQAPWGAPLDGEDVLSPPRIVNVALTVTSNSVSDASDYADALRELDGFANVVISSAAVGTEGDVTTNIALALSTDAVVPRYTAETETADESAED